MTSTGSRKNRRTRLLLISGCLAALIVFVVLPTAPGLLKRAQISSALASASAVRLEEFIPGYGEPDTILSKVALLPSDHPHVLEALPMHLAVGIPGLFKPCYVPHHRVIITTPDQRELSLGICFTCNEFSFPDAAASHSVIRLPHAWREPLRKLFLRHGVPIRDQYPTR